MELSLSSFIAAFYSALTFYSQQHIDPDAPLKDTPQNKLARTYDIIIVGGGTAGSVLASRLTEVSSLSVLVIEAGDDENALSDNPLLYRGDLEYNFTTIGQRGFCQAEGGKCHYIRGRGFGGTSAVSNMAYVRGHPADYDHWAELGNKDWSWKEVFKYFLKLENYKIRDLEKSPYHGTNGPWYVRYPKWRTLLRKEYLKAGEEFGWKRTDYNGKYQYGIDYTQLSLDGTTRLSASQAYLVPVAKRKNLTILKKCQVSRIIINKKTKTAEGVEYMRGGSKYMIKAQREVIITTGSVDSAQLLLLSGIGPKNHLKKLGIPLICDLPVGKHFQDQPHADVMFEIDRPYTLTTDVWRTNESAVEYAKTGTGPLATTGEEANAFFNPLKNEKLPNSLLRFFSWIPTEKISQSQNKHVITVRVVLLQPKSVGSVSLKSSKLHDAPLVNPSYLRDDYDYAVLQKSVKTAIEFMKTPTMMKYSPKLFTDRQPKCKNKKEKDFIKCIIEYYSQGISNGVGTARMGSDKEKSAVVTQEQLFVRGVKSLRVVSEAVIPYITRGYANVCAIMLAEKAADLIKSYYDVKELEVAFYPEGQVSSSSPETVPDQPPSHKPPVVPENPISASFAPSNFPNPEIGTYFEMYSEPIMEAFNSIMYNLKNKNFENMNTIESR